MSAAPDPAHPTGHTDITVSELDVESNDQRPETNDPAFTDNGSLGGLGGSDDQAGGAG